MKGFALAVIGSGSGNALITCEFEGARVALIESGAFGGTCINRGCIPTKMFAYTADVAMHVRQASRFGLTAELEAVNWTAIRDRVFARVAATALDGQRGRASSPNVSLFEGRAHFEGPHQLVINEEEHIEAEQVVIATGGRPSIPPIVATSEVEYHTSDTVMQIDTLPASMVILGGGSVAVEFAHLFSSLGVAVRIVEKASVLMANLDEEISLRFTAEAKAKWEVYLNATVVDVGAERSGAVLVLDDGTRVSGELLLVATGRQPNTDDLGLDLAGVTERDGRIVVDTYGRAGPGIWALGDCSSPFELKHVANAEARTVAHNLTHSESLRPLPHDWVPSAVFSDPQIASVGARSQDLEGTHYLEARQLYGDTAFGWAMQDHRGFCKLYADSEAGTLLGAHILGDQASLLIAPLIQAVAHGQRVADLARGQYWIHPTLSEVVENALLKLDVDHEVRSGQVH